jgi:hypothetical protein
MSATALARSDLTVANAPTSTSPANAVTARFQRAVAVVGDLLLTTAVVLCIPFVILAIGIPIALFLRLLLWIARLI